MFVFCIASNCSTLPVPDVCLLRCACTMRSWRIVTLLTKFTILHTVYSDYSTHSNQNQNRANTRRNYEFDCTANSTNSRVTAVEMENPITSYGMIRHRCSIVRPNSRTFRTWICFTGLRTASSVQHAEHNDDNSKNWCNHRHRRTKTATAVHSLARQTIVVWQSARQFLFRVLCRADVIPCRIVNIPNGGGLMLVRSKADKWEES